MQEAIWIKSLVGEYTTINDAILINEDNQGAIDLTTNSKNHARTKHIDIKYHFIKEKVRDNEINVKFCPSEQMLADIFTKPLGTNLFNKFAKLLNLQDSSEFRGSVGKNS